MREYGQIQTALWMHPDFISLSNNGKLLVTYLLAGPHSNGNGCYYLPDGYLLADLGMDADTLCHTLSEVTECGFLKRCSRTNYAFIPKFLKWNTVASGKVCACRLKEVQAIPAKFMYMVELKADFDKYIPHRSANYDTVWDRVFDRVSDTVCHTGTDQTRTEPKGKNMSDSDESDALFETEYQAARKAYKPKNQNDNQKRAWKAWKARVREHINPADLLLGIQRYSKRNIAESTPPAKIMHMSTFLNADKSWEQPWAAVEKVPTDLAAVRRLVAAKNIEIPDNSNLFEARKIIANETGMSL